MAPTRLRCQLRALRASQLARCRSCPERVASGTDALALLLQGKLWRQSGFCPPDKHCMQIKERKASFVEWKESAQLEFQKTQLLKTSESSASGVREDPMMSARDMTEAQAEQMLKVLQKSVLKLAKESNECKDHRRRVEKNLASLKAESVTAAGLRMQGLKEEGARLAATKEQDLQAPNLKSPLSMPLCRRFARALIFRMRPAATGRGGRKHQGAREDDARHGDAAPAPQEPRVTGRQNSCCDAG